MRLLRMTSVILFIATIVLGGLINFQSILQADTSYPQINSDSEEIEVSFTESDDTLLQGLTAYDEKDGDLTSQIVVEKISGFIEPGTCHVTYAVSDFDNHVSKYTRALHYTDYESPEFSLTAPLIFRVGSSASLLSYIQAYDVLDGDITDEIRLLSSNVSTDSVGVYEAKFEVSNSKGDVQELNLNVYVEESMIAIPQIFLSKYLVYADVGDRLDMEDYIQQVVDSDGINSIAKDRVHIDTSHVHMNEPGAYPVEFDVKGSNGNTGQTVLYIVVR